MLRFLLIVFLSVSWLWSQDNKISNDLSNNSKSSQQYFKKSSSYNTQIRKNKKTFNKAVKYISKETVNKSNKKEAIVSEEKNTTISNKPLLSNSIPKKKKNLNILKNSKWKWPNLFEDKIALGLGFDTDKPLITCKIGYFLNRHLLVGGNFSGSINSEYYPAFAGDYVIDTDPNSLTFSDLILVGGHPDYTLNNTKIEFGLFARLYTLNTLFVEVDLTRKISEDDEWLPATYFDVLSDDFVTENMVNRIRRNSTNLGFGIGYPIVWNSTLSFEPFVKFDIILSGKYSDSSQTYKISGSRVVAGANIVFLF